jgi:hypothetical protein
MNQQFVDILNSPATWYYEYGNQIRQSLPW